MESCYVEGLVVAEAELESNLSTALDISGEGGKDDLLSVQNAWEAYREKQCNAVYKSYEGGSIAGVQMVACKMHLNQLRTNELWNTYILGREVAVEQIKWDETSTVKADIDCDGIIDTAKLGYIEKSVRLAVTIGATEEIQSFDFGLGESGAQGSLCGTEAILRVTDMDYDLLEAFGANPVGFKQSKTCKGLNVSAGDCDSMHIFWNHETKEMGLS
jgi:hypothetical protein